MELRGGPTRKSHFSVIDAFRFVSSSVLKLLFSVEEEHPASNSKIDKYRIPFSLWMVEAYVTQ
jgi:hypothetical protein